MGHPVSGLPHAVLWGTMGREEQVKVVSRPGVAGFLPVKDCTDSAAFNLKAVPVAVTYLPLQGGKEKARVGFLVV